MNYPLWELPGAGLLIAVVAILHVFVSHFAVGGGLFLVVTELKARRENDQALLDYLQRHSRFFILLTLVFGAVSGVGIWFTIGLVHPAATSALINAFVWGWAIEWTFFLTEIAAALVYYYGWQSLTPRQHLIVGWIYFACAWASLFVINGILAFMLTPGDWIATHSFADGFFNPTFWSSVVVRTLGAIGIAGIYALFTASWIGKPELKKKLARYAALGWVLPMAIGLPPALFWYFAAADGAGVPIAAIFGAKSASPADLLTAAFTTVTSGHPIAQLALRTAILSISAMIVLVFGLLLFRRERYGRIATAAVMIAGLCSIGASEWAREGLRKPFVIGSYMFVNGTRLPPPDGSPVAAIPLRDPLQLANVDAAGVLQTAHFVRLSDATRTAQSWTLEQEKEAGAEVFRLLCSQCHTTDRYLAIRPLVKGKSSGALEGVITRLAAPRDAAGQPAGWSAPGVRLATWRERRMPPFAGTAAEKRALAVYLATIGGGTISPPPAAVDPHLGASYFDANCAACHGADAEWPMAALVAGKPENVLYDTLGKLPALNEMMPPFEGTEAERRALAKHLLTLAPQGGK